MSWIFEREFATDLNDYAMPPEIIKLLEQGVLVDTSWHNDACPSFEHADAPEGVGQDHWQLRLWVETVDPNLRENGPTWPRFSVGVFSNDVRQRDVPTVLKMDHYEGDNVRDALACLLRLAEEIKQLRKART